MRVFCAAIFVVAALAPARAADLPPASPADAQQHYDRCLDDARATPQKGLDEAEAWRDAGGGFPADHCAAVALFALHRYTDAAQAFEALAGALMGDRAPLRAGAMEQAGESWLLANEPKKAFTAFTAALQFTPQDPNLYIGRARADAEEKDWAAAIAGLNAALAIAPGKVDALVYRASAYRQLGDLPRARADIDAALKEVPDDADALLERGNIRRLQDDAAGARQDWQRVEQLAPGSPADQAAKGNIARLASGGGN